MTGLLERLAARGSADLNKPLNCGETDTSLVAVSELQARYLNEMLNIPRTLQRLSRDVMAQSAPTQPTQNSFYCRSGRHRLRLCVDALGFNALGLGECGAESRKRTKGCRLRNTLAKTLGRS